MLCRTARTRTETKREKSQTLPAYPPRSTDTCAQDTVPDGGIPAQEDTTSRTATDVVDRAHRHGLRVFSVRASTHPAWMRIRRLHVCPHTGSAQTCSLRLLLCGWRRMRTTRCVRASRRGGARLPRPCAAPAPWCPQDPVTSHTPHASCRRFSAAASSTCMHTQLSRAPLLPCHTCLRRRCLRRYLPRCLLRCLACVHAHAWHPAVASGGVR